MSVSLVETVYKWIIRQIIEGTLLPGESINRRDVARTLNTSISPVNEAFALLQVDELIITKPRKGTFINKLDYRELGDLLEVRIALETSATEKIAGEALQSNKEHLLELAAVIDSMSLITPEHLIADVKFHRTLVNLAGNKYLSKIYDSVITRSLVLAMDSTVNLLIKPDEGLNHTQMVEELCLAGVNEIRSIVRKNAFGGKEKLLAATNNNLLDNKKYMKSRSGDSLDLVLKMMTRQNR